MGSTLGLFLRVQVFLVVILLYPMIIFAETIYTPVVFENTNHELRIEIPDNYTICAEAYGKMTHDRQIGTTLETPEYHLYVIEDTCGGIIEKIAIQLYEYVDRLHFDDLRKANFLLAWVENYHYVLDKESTGVDEYARYPYQSVRDEEGDCEDAAILYTAILSYWCADTVLFFLENHGGTKRHVAAGIAITEFPGRETTFSDRSIRTNIKSDGTAVRYVFVDPVFRLIKKKINEEDTKIGEFRSLRDWGYISNKSDIKNSWLVPRNCGCDKEFNQRQTVIVTPETQILAIEKCK